MNKGRVLVLVHNLHQPDTFFNIGAGYLVSVLKQHGAMVDVFDMAIDNLDESDLADYLQDNSYDIIGLGFLSARFRETVEPLCKVINQYKNNALLVLGCNGASAIPEYTLKKTQADVICIGESEETIIDLLNCKINSGDYSKVKGIAYWDNNKVKINIRRKPIKNLDIIPFPHWSSFNMQKYTTNIKLALMEDNDKCFPMVSTRGCTNACTFCYRMCRGVRARSIDNVIEEMKILNQEYLVNYFFFFDELWIYNKLRVFDFAKALEKNNLNIKFNINARVDLIDEDIIKCLKDFGCVFLNFGFEASQDNILREMKKNTTVEMNYRAAEMAYKYDIGMGINVLWGFKNDDEITLRKNADFVKQFSKFDQIRTVRPVTSYPGSELYYQALREGKLKDDDDFFNKFKNSDLITVNFTDLPLEECYRLLYEVNKELVLFHYEHTNQDWDAAWKIINGFKNLYEGKNFKFRGARSDTTNADKRKITRMKGI